METIIVAIISSGALSALITGLLQYLQTKKSKRDGLESKVDDIIEDQLEIIKAQKKHEGDIVRVELKLMISSFPEKTEDILRLGQHYFKDLHGNWVMASVFKSWLDEYGIDIPNWFEDE